MDDEEPSTRGSITPKLSYTREELYSLCYKGHLSLEEAWFQMPPHFAFSILSIQDFVKWWNGEDVEAAAEHCVPPDWQGYTDYAPQHTTTLPIQLYDLLDPLQATQLYIAKATLYCKPKDSTVVWQEAKHLIFQAPDFRTTEYATQRTEYIEHHIPEGPYFTQYNAEYLASKNPAVQHSNVMYKTEHGYTLHLNPDSMQVIYEVMHDTSLLDWQSMGAYEICSQICHAMRYSVAQPSPAVYEASGEVYAKLSRETAVVLFAEMGAVRPDTATQPLYDALGELILREPTQS